MTDTTRRLAIEALTAQRQALIIRAAEIDAAYATAIADLLPAHTQADPKRGINGHVAVRGNGLSPEGRKRISEAMRKRWAKRRDALPAFRVLAGKPARKRGE